uniref:Uncharacterized protein n=1 Tax=Sphaeramia orbicularis TaxID=375764 RepID=A0A673BID2_9TELE
MNSNQQERADIQETQSGGPDETRQKRVIHFSSGETLNEDSEEVQPVFREPAKKTAKLSFKNLAILVGRVSLLTCDFFGERLAGVLGLNTAKYQYAIDQYHRDHKKAGTLDTEGLRSGQGGFLSPGSHTSNYGATGQTHPPDPDMRCGGMDRGQHNTGYQAEEDYFR